MAKTNAERQRDHRERVKARLAQANTVSDPAVEEFQQQFEDMVAEDRRQDPDYTVEDSFLSMVKDAGPEAYLPFLAQVVGLPSDPWPGLTGDALAAMTKGRSREARDLGFVIRRGDHDLGFLDKLTAARHRAWLLGKEIEMAA